MKEQIRNWLAFLVCAMMVLSDANAVAETCVTQSQMGSADRDALAIAAQAIAQKVQSNDQSALQGSTIPEFAANFSGIGSVASDTAPKLAGDTSKIEQVYLLDATDKKLNADGSAPDADFVCMLNKGASEADFSIRSLPPGRYGFAMVQFSGASHMMLSMLLRQDGSGTPWKLAGLFPKASSAAGHDGLWYWSQGREMSAKKQLWIAYIYYQQAQQLLQPAGFVSSTHLENLRTEASSAVPPALSSEMGPEAPHVIKGVDGKEYRFTSIGPDDNLHKDKLDIVAHMLVDPTVSSDPAAMHKRNIEAMSALLIQHPELRQSFHGIWIFADAPNRPSVADELAMNDIR